VETLARQQDPATGLAFVQTYDEQDAVIPVVLSKRKLTETATIQETAAIDDIWRQGFSRLLSPLPLVEAH
jgi:hypothetical protein